MRDDALPDTFKDSLRRAKLRPTLARLRVMEVLQQGPECGLPSSDIVRAVLMQPSPLAFGTVYNTVRELVAGGVLVRSWDPGGKSLYRLDHAGQPQAGMRLSCGVCGGTTHLADPALDTALQRLLVQHGATLVDQPTFVQVVCSACQTSATEAAALHAEPESGARVAAGGRRR